MKIMNREGLEFFETNFELAEYLQTCLPNSRFR